jgi:lysophospholipase L1-like esterase
MRYAAIGDSFTEGVGDELPDGSVRGWADRVAAGLASARGGEVRYANLAVRGRLLEPIVTDQLEAALSLAPAPTLITLNGGGNDMLRRGIDVARLVALTERAVRRCPRWTNTWVTTMTTLSAMSPAERNRPRCHRRYCSANVGAAAARFSASCCRFCAIRRARRRPGRPSLPREILGIVVSSRLSYPPPWTDSIYGAEP